MTTPSEEHHNGPLDDRGAPLAGVTVVGLEQSVAGPLCTRILGDLGATVVKVERRGSGDFARAWDDHVRGESGQFWWLNTGKRSVALTLSEPDDRSRFENLLGTADVLVHNMSPAAASRLGLDEDRLALRHPHLVSCQISGYGATGPFHDRKAYDMLVQAESGIMSLTGTPSTTTRVGVSICDVGAGLYAAICVLAGLAEARACGRGRCIDLSMFDVALEFLGPMLTSFMNAGVVYPRIPQHHHAIAPYGAFSCSDGEIMLAVQQDAEWRRCASAVLGQPELADDSRFATNTARVENRAALHELLEEAFASMTVAQARDRLTAGEFAFGVVNDVAAVANHPVTRHRGVVRKAEAASGQEASIPVGPAARAFGVTLAPTRPPRVDEDAELLDGLPGSEAR